MTSSVFYSRGHTGAHRDLCCRRESLRRRNGEKTESLLVVPVHRRGRLRFVGINCRRVDCEEVEKLTVKRLVSFRRSR